MFGGGTLGQSVLGGTAGGASTKSVAFDFVAVVRQSQETAFDFIVLATQSKQTSFDFIVAASGLKSFAFDFVVVDKYRDNSPWHRAIGNNLSKAIDPQKPAIWSTAERPASPLLWQEGLNTQLGWREYWNGTDWRKSSDGTASS